MITIRNERAADESAREALLDTAYGAVRHGKPSARLRKGAPARITLVATEKNRIVGTVRLWTIAAGSAGEALLLGPLAVDPEHRQRGIGSVLMRRALAAAARRGHRGVLLVGDAAFYGRFGFSAEKAARLRISGLAERSRLLALELVPGALDGAHGWLAAAPTRASRLGSLKRLVRSPKLLPRAA